MSAQDCNRPSNFTQLPCRYTVLAAPPTLSPFCPCLSHPTPAPLPPTCEGSFCVNSAMPRWCLLSSSSMPLLRGTRSADGTSRMSSSPVDVPHWPFAVRCSMRMRCW